MGNGHSGEAGMVNLSLAAAFFLGLHLLVAGTGARGFLVARLGRSIYMALFSLASLSALIWLISAYPAAAASAANIMLPGFPMPEWVIHLCVVAVAIAVPLAVIGITTPNPTTAGMEAVLEREDAVRGVLRITRHPMLWGILIWAVAHFLVNGDAAASIVFGMFIMLTALGTRSIDAKRRKALGENWNAFAGATSNVPFGAILAGRQTLRPGEIHWWQYVAGLAAFGFLFYAHQWLFGVSPVPGWSPY